jgi:hypothetical protein
MPAQVATSSRTDVAGEVVFMAVSFRCGLVNAELRFWRESVGETGRLAGCEYREPAGTCQES